MTYSIVARDPSTGELGVAVQSHYFATGSVVTWAAPGVGAVATQAMAEISYGPLGLDLMRAGKSAPDALRALLAADDASATRQVAMVDASGRVATHTGDKCIADAGHLTGDGWSVQANMMRRDTVWAAMATAYEAAEGDLADRLLAALDAAEAEGGDIRGKQSASLLVVPATGARWDTTIDVRVDDHPEPLPELRRLVAMRKAYLSAQDGPAMGDNPELAFWMGMALGIGGQVDEAMPLLRKAYAADEGWAELLRRLPVAGLFPDDPDLLDRLTR
ncbi:MAG: DUF1028 domain-containing protein [Actinobacteria bacterium]|nr:DUF1028 domain-containing protein [Actinomycetota bacterium]